MNRLTEGGLTTASKAYRRSPKKKQSLRIKGFAEGGEVEETNYLLPNVTQDKPKGALNQMANAPAAGRVATEGQIEKANSQMDKKSILDNAIKKLQGNMNDPTAIKEVAGAMLGGLQEQNEARRAQLQAQLDPNSEDARWRKAERLFNLSAAFAKPQQRGSGLGGVLQNLGEAGTGYAKSMSEERKINQALEREMAGLNFDPKILQTLKETSGLTAPSSNYGKQALDEGFVAGTPEFAKRVKQLHQDDIDTKRMKYTTEKPLSNAEGKRVEALGINSTNNINFVSKIDEQIDRVKKASWWQTGVPGTVTSKVGLGLGAEIATWIESNAPSQRPAGAGATSDYDAKGYKKALGSGLGQKEILNVLESAKQAKLNDAARDQYFASVIESRGNISEATKQWNEYVRKYPSIKNGKANTDRPTFEAYLGKEAAQGDGKQDGAKQDGAKPGAPGKVKAKATKVLNGKTYYQHSDGHWDDEDEK